MIHLREWNPVDGGGISAWVGGNMVTALFKPTMLARRAVFNGYDTVVVEGDHIRGLLFNNVAIPCNY